MKAYGIKDRKYLELKVRKELCLKVNLFKIKKKVLEYLFGIMEMTNTQDSGRMG